MNILVQVLSLANQRAQGSAGTLGAARRVPACGGPRGRERRRERAGRAGAPMMLQSTMAPPDVLSVTTSRLFSRFMSSIWGAPRRPAGQGWGLGVGRAKHSRAVCEGRQADLRSYDSKLSLSLACCMPRRPTCCMRCCGWPHPLAPHAVTFPVHVNSRQDRWRHGSGLS